MRGVLLAVVAGFAAVVGAAERLTLPESTWRCSEWLSVPQAKLVTDDDRARRRAAPGTSWFATRQENEKSVLRATWMTTGLGVYEIYVNGMAVGTDVLKPGYTQVEKTRRSFTYDVTGLMRRAKGACNEFLAEVSSGWWRDGIVKHVGRKSAFRSVLEVQYDDGSSRLFGTNVRDWRAGVGGPVTQAGIYDGEECDARIPVPAYETMGAAERNDEFSGEILPTDGAEVCRRDDLALSPTAAYCWKGVEAGTGTSNAFGRVVKTRVFDVTKPFEVLPGETLVVDFAQNCAGQPYFEMSAEPGTVLTCLPGEMLNDAKGETSRGNDGPGGSVYRANLRGPNDGMRIVYTFGERDAVTYQPRFSFFGYRYLSVTATGRVTLRVKSVPVTSVTREMEAGSLETGVPALNRLIQNVYWGQLSNYLSVPTDCPQRNERLGWSADTQVFCDAGMFNADALAFFRKWTRDLRDARSEDGGYPSLAPLSGYRNPTFTFGWADAGVIVPWTVWLHSGDRRILEANYAAMARFVRKIDEMRYDFEAKNACIYADWLSFETFETCGNAYGDNRKWKNDPDARNYRLFLAACYWLYDARIMKDVATVLGKAEDAAEFSASAERALRHIRSSFVDGDGLLLKPMRHLQTACVFVLRLGLLDGEAAEKTKKILLKSIADHGGCLQTGFLGTSFIMDALTLCGEVGTAYDLLLNHRHPSWLYQVDQGATTVWERWNSYTKSNGFGPVGMNSFNHYAYGAVVAWMYRVMAGIAPDPTNPGFRNILLAPRPDRRIGHVRAEHRTSFGLVKSAWRYEGEKWVWDFEIPPGATASVTLPDGKPAGLFSAGRHRLEQ